MTEFADTELAGYAVASELLSPSPNVLALAHALKQAFAGNPTLADALASTVTVLGGLCLTASDPRAVASVFSDALVIFVDAAASSADGAKRGLS